MARKAALSAEKAILPVNGSREALFAFAQVVIDTTKKEPVVISPNPFYQIYEGAALLAGARAQGDLFAPPPEAALADLRDDAVDAIAIAFCALGRMRL